ncbi:MAG: hypothetical protein QOE65_1093 [Solirubrobacteraceae bacterium]|jgi:hypothetical protein|nr:hypothetical protein [Solirubrobacteraceae bacterium]
MEAATPPDFSPPYVPFRTLLNAIQRMQDEGMPSRLDRSYLSNLPWSTQNHFLAACRALGLTDNDGKPTRLLVQLVEEPDKRGTVFADVLRSKYPNVVSLGTNATQEQLEEQFKPFGLGGSTLRKAVAFYLHAAKFAEVPLSPHFRSPRTTTRQSTSRRRPKAAPAPTAANGDAQPVVSSDQDITSSDLHPFLQGLLRELPEEGEPWTEAKRRRWLQIAELTVDMLYEVEDK